VKRRIFLLSIYIFIIVYLSVVILDCNVINYCIDNSSCKNIPISCYVDLSDVGTHALYLCPRNWSLPAPYLKNKNELTVQFRHFAESQNKTLCIFNPIARNNALRILQKTLCTSYVFTTNNKTDMVDVCGQRISMKA
jgi:hypothetical protein